MFERKPVVLIILIALFFYSLFSLASAREELTKLRCTAEELREEYAQLVSDNAELEAALENSGTPEDMERLAREKLGLVYPGEKVFYFIHTDREE